MILTSEMTEAQQSEEHWHGYINQRLDQANALLHTISNTIETVDPHSREHAADLLDAAIANLQRLHDRLAAHHPETDPGNQAFSY